jgi:hypothetical protein
MSADAPARAHTPALKVDEVQDDRQRVFLIILAEVGHPWYWRRMDPTFAALEQQAKRAWEERHLSDVVRRAEEACTRRWGTS